MAISVTPISHHDQVSVFAHLGELRMRLTVSVAVLAFAFGHTKHNRGVTSFHRRGRTAVRTEWRLVMATHNLTKLHRHTIATQRA
jgi:hypothetical protein